MSHAQYYDDSTSTTTHPPPPRPYEFAYTAGRFPGHVDRSHSEVSDGTGVVRGAFSYIDPRQEIRTVEYVADQDGFHPTLDHQLEEPQQSEAVKQATIRHFEAYNRIAERNANVINILNQLYSLLNMFRCHFRASFAFASSIDIAMNIDIETN